MNTWKLCFLDVWGNEEEGFEVNDIFPIDCIELEENFTNQDLIHELLAQNYLCSFAGQVKDVFSVDGDDEFVTIDDAKDGFPLFHLYKETDNG